MKKLLLGVLLVSIITFSPSCDDCEVNPDLTIDLLVPAADIIMGEPVDWEYIISSTEENSLDCDILRAAASIARIVIDIFIDKNDKGTVVYERETAIGELNAGDKQSVVNVVNVFTEPGVYTVNSTADINNAVTERNEENNVATPKDVTLEGKLPEIFNNASDQFKEKFSTAAAIVIVGNTSIYKSALTSYNGKPIYYVSK